MMISTSSNTWTVHRFCCFRVETWSGSYLYYLQHFSISLFPFPPFFSITSESLPHTHPVAILMLVLIQKPVLARTVLGSPRLGHPKPTLSEAVKLPICLWTPPSLHLCWRISTGGGFTMANLGRLCFILLAHSGVPWEWDQLFPHVPSLFPSYHHLNPCFTRILCTPLWISIAQQVKYFLGQNHCLMGSIPCR
jgi:hypothetical protein